MSTTESPVQAVSGKPQATNGAKPVIDSITPYVAHITITGTSELLFHAWNCESIESKGAAAKGSLAKNSDDLESYVFRDEERRICFPTEYLRMAICYAAKSMQDPRSPRKSAFDMCKAGLASLSPMSVLLNANGDPTTEWDFIHRCRVRIQLSAITRCRPAFHKGWSTTCDLLVLTPEYLPAAVLHDLATQAGRLVGVADFRPTYGRFRVTNFATGLED